MKRFTCLLLVIFLVISISACGSHDNGNSAVFYYPRSSYSYSGSDSVITSESRTTDGYLAISNLLQYYMQGPEDINLINPFPQNITVHSVLSEGTVLSIVLSDHMADLADVQLILACVCLAKTAIGITNASSVRISCDTELLAGKNYIEINDNMVFLEDLYPASTQGSK